MEKMKVFLSSVLAGVCIAIGGMAYLSCDNKVLGAFFFVVGLFTICTFKLDLFTGKVCYVFERDKSYAYKLPIIWTGNLVGTWVAAQLHLLTRYGEALREKAKGLAGVKLSDSVLSIFILAIFCNILIYIAVEGYSRISYEMGKYLALILGVMVFILCGFEHCVANMYYFSVAEVWDLKALGFILVMSLGNSVGAVVVPAAERIFEKGRHTQQ